MNTASESTTLTPDELALAKVILDSVDATDVKAEDIDPNSTIVGHDPNGRGLGFDSIDVLEIALAINQVYGVELKHDNVNVRTAFVSLRTLAKYIKEYAPAAPGELKLP